MPIIKENWTSLWNAQEMRILVLASLCFQWGMIFLSPLRKRSGQKLLIFLLWLFYLLADYVTILALGNLLKKQKDGASGSHEGVGLGAFWAPFLLLQLGGPDTITSLSIQDNELWLRHLLGLVSQVVVAVTVLLELVVIPQLGVPASFVFIAGLMKYSERIWALRSSSMDKLRSSMFKSIKKAGNIIDITRSNESLLSNIVDGHYLFKRTMPLVGDLRLTSNELYNCRAYFQNCSVWKAFKLVEIELSFLYDVLHTKAVLTNGPRGCIWRFVSLVLIYSPFVLFLMNDEKTDYAKADIIITYVLFGSALFIELISLLQIIFSKWMIVALEQKEYPLLKKMAHIIATVMSFFYSERKPQWSNSMGQYSLLGAVKVKNLWDKVKNLWDKFFNHSVLVRSELKHLLVEQLRNRLSVDLQELKDGKGERVLQQEACNHLRWSIKDKEFEESILLWHIATDLCHPTHVARNDDGSSPPDRDISLIVSNYMVYLLVMQPSMMPEGIGKIRFEDTCAAVEFFYHSKERSGFTEEEARKALLDLSEANDEYLEQKTTSVLSDARRLANQLLDIKEEDKRWRLISRVWLEMLGHAAINCKTYNHAMQLSKGGELLTHVYLLMAHMCIGDAGDAVHGGYYRAFINKMLLKA